MSSKENGAPPSNNAAHDGGGDDDSQHEGPVSSFQSLEAEGDILFKQGDFRKAIEAFSKALNQRPTDKSCLVARSRCYLHLGDPQSALRDAELALKEDKDFFKGKFQKAEALYAMGDFEMALVYYHRGHKLRPELDEFRLGIQKAREAIDNSIGNPKDYKLRSPINWTSDSGKNEAMSPSPMAANNAGGNYSHAAGSAGHRRNVNGAVNGSSGVNKTLASTAADIKNGNSTADEDNGAAGGRRGHRRDLTEKQLLGELYSDKEYLQELIEDRDFITSPSDGIYELVNEGLRYLETRTEFWRQQKPIYARKKEQSRIAAKVQQARQRQLAAKMHKQQEVERAAKEKAANTAAHRATGKKPKLPSSSELERSFIAVGQALEQKHFVEALQHAEQLQAKLQSSTLPERDRFVAKLWNILGNIHFELGNYEKALEQYEKDLQASTEQENGVDQARALGNLGRVHVKLQHYDQARDVWQRRLQFEATPLERAWLHHDVARCELLLGNPTHALECGKLALDAANEADELEWQLNATILLDQLEQPDISDDYYRQAYDIVQQMQRDQVVSLVVGEASTAETPAQYQERAENAAALVRANHGQLEGSSFGSGNSLRGNATQVAV